MCFFLDIAYLAEDYLLGDSDNETPQPRSIRVSRKADLSCSGSDCDMSWICLFICILALCFAIPLIYVIYIAEHPDKYRHAESSSMKPQ